MLIGLQSSHVCAARQGRPSKAELSPEPCLPRFAKYYRDAAGVEFRTLMKAYGIRFDIMVNGRVCELRLPSGAGQVRGGAGLLGRRWPGSLGILLSTGLPHPALSLCASGREV